jgi:hypothetical protein
MESKLEWKNISLKDKHIRKEYKDRKIRFLLLKGKIIKMGLIVNVAEIERMKEILTNLYY